MWYICRQDSPLGRICMASEGETLQGLWFEGQVRTAGGGEESFHEAHLPVFQQTARWLDGYFRGETGGERPSVEAAGTDFQQAVWAEVLAVPYGKTASYGELAERIGARRGRPTSPRAVGRAVGANPVLLLTPCHRIVGAGGALTGYAGGLDRKKWLLSWEAAHLTDL